MLQALAWGGTILTALGMAQKRRRHSAELQNNKRPKTNSQPSLEKAHHHHVLSAYFPALLVLRKYLIATLSSVDRTSPAALLSYNSKLEDTLSMFLNLTLIGFNGDVPNGNLDAWDLQHTDRPSQSEVNVI